MYVCCMENFFVCSICFLCLFFCTCVSVCETRKVKVRAKRETKTNTSHNGVCMMACGIH